MLVAQSAAEHARRAPPPAPPTTIAGRGRRSLALGLGLLASALQAPPAHAFGKGFPGYDVNIEAQKRAQGRVRSELQLETDKGVPPQGGSGSLSPTLLSESS